MCVCSQLTCVQLLFPKPNLFLSNFIYFTRIAGSHTHTHIIYIYIYIWECAYVCVCLCVLCSPTFYHDEKSLMRKDEH